MPKRIFVSFNYADRAFHGQLRSFFQAMGGAVEATPVWVDENVAAQGDAAVKQAIRRVMEGCQGALLVVGDNVHNSPWISHELSLADSLRIPKAAVRHPQASGGLPHQHLGMQLVAWKPAVIADLIRSW